MKKNIKFELAGKKYSVDVERQGDVLLIENEGKTVTVNLLETERRPSKQAAAAPAAAPAAPRPAPAAPAAPAVEATTTAAPAAAGSGDVVSPMTGIIKQITVSKGETVKAGQIVFVMEAMKMDVEIPSPIPGTVTEIYIGVGGNVKDNQPVIKLS